MELQAFPSNMVAELSLVQYVVDRLKAVIENEKDDGEVRAAAVDVLRAHIGSVGIELLWPDKSPRVVYKEKDGWPVRTVEFRKKDPPISLPQPSSG